jgi:DNA-binding transcriptional regulator GbsR (MarR family)
MKKFRDKIKHLQKNNSFLEVWKWQNCMFSKNILDTIDKAKSGLKSLRNELEDDFKKHNIEII